jgi:hypothetical protein
MRRAFPSSSLRRENSSYMALLNTIIIRCVLHQFQSGAA